MEDFHLKFLCRESFSIQLQQFNLFFRIIFKRLVALIGSRSYRSVSSSGDSPSKQISTRTRKMVITGSRLLFLRCCPTPSTYAGSTSRHSRTTASNQIEYLREHKFGGLSQEAQELVCHFTMLNRARTKEWRDDRLRETLVWSGTDQ